MKIQCEFCKTEYSAPRDAAGSVRCAVCGHVWTPPRGGKRPNALVLFAALTALLAATVFAFAATSVRGSGGESALIATIGAIDTVKNDAGVSQFVVRGSIKNVSKDIHGIPDMIAISIDADGNVVARQKFMPTATLMEPGSIAEFEHTLSVPTENIKKITIELESK